MIEFRKHGYGEFDADRGIGPAEWPHHDLLFVHRGTVILEFPALDRTITVERGTGVLVWPYTAFQGFVVSAAARVSIQHFHVPVDVASPFDSLVGQRRGATAQGVPRSLWLEQCVTRAQELAREIAVRHARDALLALILSDGGYLGAAPPAVAAKRIDAARLGDWLRANLHCNPGVPEMARQVGLSPSRFRAVFLAEQGKTASELLLTVRMTEAHRLLAETNEPLKAIAVMLGHADAVVFHRAFKHRSGCTPAAYRREHRTAG